MKLIVLCVLIAIYTADAFSPGGDLVPCSCAPGAPVCGSDLKTYYGECNLRCAAAQRGTQISLIYNGPCEDLFKNRDYNNLCPCTPYNPYPYNPYNPYVPVGPFLGSSARQGQEESGK